MNFVELSVKRPVLVSMILSFLVVLGLFSYGRIGLDMLPRVDIPVITIMTVYPGASPENIETLISKPIEDAVSSTNGIDKLRSDSYEGMSNVIIEFDDDVDIDEAAADVREKVGAIRANLPDDAKEPVILKIDINALPILSLAITGERPTEEIYRLAKDQVKDELLKIDGVADIDFIGGREREILVEANQETLKAYALSPVTLAGLLKQKNLNLPSGHITHPRKEYTIRMDGEFQSVEEVARMSVPTPSGKPYLVQEIARVRDGYEEKRQEVRLNGRKAVAMVVKKRSDANSVRTSGLVLARVAELQRKLPDDIRIEAVRNRATFIVESVEDLNGNIVSGILITALILFAFLHSFKATFVSVLSIPISIVATYTLLYAAGFTLNMMTLMALAISVGVLVNNAIIVLENIYVKLGKGRSIVDAVTEGTGEIMVAVSGCTLTNVVVFIPIAFMSGIIGRFFYQFGMTVTFATFVSLLVAFTLTPMAARFLLTAADADPEQKYRFGRWWDAMFARLSRVYRSVLETGLRYRVVVLAGTVGVVVASFLLAPFIGFEFVTEPDQGEFDITVKMPPGSSLANTDAILRQIEASLQAMPQVRFALTKLGKTESLIGGSGSGTNIGEISVKLRADRGMSTDRFIELLTPRVANLPDAELNIRKTGLMGTNESQFQVDITGDDMATLQDLEGKVLEIVRGTPGTVDVLSSFQSGKPELRITPRRDELTRFGVTETFLAMTLRTYFEGATGATYREGDDEYDIRVRLDGQSRLDIAAVKDMLVITPAGVSVPLAHLARVEETSGPVQINRKARTKLIKISANIAGRSLGEVLNDVKAKTDRLPLGIGYSIFFAGEIERMSESFESIGTAMLLATVFTYMLLAGLMESLIHPFTILTAFPVAFPGIILGLFFTGQTLSIFSLMAVVMMIGIVVNNGILLIEEFELRTSGGKNVLEAVLEGSPEKLRPIIMTTVATVAAMVPLALGQGAGGEMRAAMATVSIGGLLVSGVMSIILIPILYFIVEGRLRPFIRGGQLVAATLGQPVRLERDDREEMPEETPEKNEVAAGQGG